MNKKEIAGYAKRARRVDKDESVLNICSGKKVLDVGCIGQDRNFQSENWLHNKIRKVAGSVHGVDILLDPIKELKSQGYLMYSVDELKELGNIYDVIVMADVIEHVNDPVAFLSFYSTFLSQDGRIFISTPNANRSNNFVNILFNNTYSVNEEHTFWFCPRTFSEVVSRAQLNIQDFYWADQYYGAEKIKGLYQKFKFFAAQKLAAWRSNFNPNMIFFLSKDK